MKTGRLETATIQQSGVAVNKVLRNTYLLLALTLAFSAVVAFVTMLMNWPMPNMLVFFGGFIGLSILVSRTADSIWGLPSIFALTGFMGYTIGPILSAFLGAGMGDVVLMAFGGTALVFFGLSAYVLISGKDMSFLGGMIQTGFWVLVGLIIANIFLELPALSMAMSALFILFSSALILWQTSAIIHGGERNYINATATLFVSIYNIFLSLLSILGMSND